MTKAIEELFHKDSEFAIYMLDLFDVENEDELEKAYIIGLGTMLKELTENEDEMFKIIDSNQYHQVYRDKFRKNRKRYMDIVENILNNDIEIIDNRIIEVKVSLLTREETLRKLNKNLSRLVDGKKNTNYRKDIILSLMHMYCNRLTGVRSHEEQYLAIIRHALYSILEKRKHMRGVNAISE